MRLRYVTPNNSIARKYHISMIRFCLRPSQKLLLRAHNRPSIAFPRYKYPNFSTSHQTKMSELRAIETKDACPGKLPQFNPNNNYTMLTTPPPIVAGPYVHPPLPSPIHINPHQSKPQPTPLHSPKPSSPPPPSTSPANSPPSPPATSPRAP